MGRNPAFERGLKKPSGGGGRSPGEFLAAKGFAGTLGQSRFPSVRAFALLCSVTLTCRGLLTQSSQSISRALREECNIQHKAFAMVYLDTHGRTKFQASSAIEPSLDDIFTADVCERFAQAVEGKLRGRRPAPNGQRSSMRSPWGGKLTAR